MQIAAGDLTNRYTPGPQTDPTRTGPNHFYCVLGRIVVSFFNAPGDAVR